jgi:hypothetical protein
MNQRKTTNGLDFESLRLGLERCDLDLILGFYAEDAELSIVNAQAQRSSPFELRGRAEIAKHLRTVFGQETSHSVEREDFVGEDRVTFRETCEYPDGGRLWVETTLEVHDGKIVRQADVVVKDAQSVMRSPLGFLGATVLLLALPIAVLTQVLFGSGSGTTIHVALGVGCALVALSVFDFETPRWVAWIGCVAAGSFAGIVLVQAASELIQNDSFT